MKLWNTLKRVNSKSFLRLIILAFKNPLFLYPTLKATKTCVEVSTLHYGREHYKNTPANAFRHAFWNYSIAHNCSKWNSNQTKVLQWAKTITDWHENAFGNKELPRAMDFHNNAIGRNTYTLFSSQSLETATQELLTMTEKAVQVQSTKDISNASELLVYICPT